MRYGRSRLPKLLIISVFGIGGGFYVFQPTFRQLQQQRTGTTATEPAATTSKGTMSMPAITRMFQMLKGSPVAVVGGTILVTGSLLYTYRAVYRPFITRRERAESEAMANYIFQMEQSKGQRQTSEHS
uniref:uncharacterized protein LOC120960217 n=1 Tax=Anopheles coluzzii TaxID=1518534 RepID=UPI0020FFC106|nr:uncharacterized protein LOC120960217 [Anopheles coluzzii]